MRIQFIIKINIDGFDEWWQCAKLTYEISKHILMINEKPFKFYKTMVNLPHECGKYAPCYFYGLFTLCKDYVRFDTAKIRIIDSKAYYNLSRALPVNRFTKNYVLYKHDIEISFSVK